MGVTGSGWDPLPVCLQVQGSGLSFFFLSNLEVEPRTSHLTDKHSTVELHLQTCSCVRPKVDVRCLSEVLHTSHFDTGSFPDPRAH